MKPKKHSLKKDILFILVSGFVVVVFWIGFNIYHIWATSTISEDLQSKLTPISGSFDTTTLEKLKKREQVNPAYDATAPETTPTPVEEVASASAKPVTNVIESPVPTQ